MVRLKIIFIFVLFNRYAEKQFHFADIYRYFKRYLREITGRLLSGLVRIFAAFGPKFVSSVVEYNCGLSRKDDLV